MRVNQRTIWLRVFSLVCLLTSATILQAADQPLTDFTTDEKDKTHWFDIQNLDVEGKGWTDTESFYDRLPKKAKGVVRPPVWSLSKHSAGIAVRFVTDATTIKARWTLTSASLASTNDPVRAASIRRWRSWPSSTQLMLAVVCAPDSPCATPVPSTSSTVTVSSGFGDSPACKITPFCARNS